MTGGNRDRSFAITVYPAPLLRPGGDPARSEDHAWPKFGRALRLRLDELERALIAVRRVAGKFQGEFYVGGHLRDNRRLKANVEGMDVLSLDVDHGLTAPEVHARLRPWRHSIWHTFRHSPGAPRCRAAIPLDRTVSGDEYVRLWGWASRLLDGVADPQASDPSRACLFPPLRPDGSRAVARAFSDAPLLVPDEVMPPPAPVVPRPPMNPVHASPALADRVARMRLRTSDEARHVAASLLEARVTGGRAEHIICPNCQRPSVWFWIAPGRMSSARCDHRSSCGWYGGLDTLLDRRGELHVG